MDWLADDEQHPPGGQADTLSPPWKLLVVDDEEEVHRVTRLALRRFRYEGRCVELLKASNGAEACQIMEQHPDVAVVFLDVVMETDDAGLRVIDHIRNRLGNHLVRIIVRTGQAGRAPEISIVTKYDINGYREKTELTSDKLLSQLYTSLSSYRDLMALNAEMAHRREAANKLVQQYAQLQEANRRLEHFAKAASHDLQEPLRKIQIWADRLMSVLPADTDSEVTNISQKIIASSQKVSNLVAEIKQASLLEAEQPPLSRISLNALLEEVVADVLEDHAESPPVIEWTGLPDVQGDHASLKLLFSSLIKDIALINPAHTDVCISVEGMTTPNGWLKIIFQDNGCGIEPDELEKIYEPYSNVVINGVACRGIGLYLSKRIVEIHGGRISCSSESGKGTKVSILLPDQQSTPVRLERLTQNKSLGLAPLSARTPQGVGVVLGLNSST